MNNNLLGVHTIFRHLLQMIDGSIIKKSVDCVMLSSLSVISTLMGGGGVNSLPQQ